MMPDDWKGWIGKADAIFFGWLDLAPGQVSLCGSLLQFRREYDQYVVRLMPSAKCPLAGREPSSIDFIVVRENTEGE